ncbi:AMP-binding protein, partial [Bordetella hinzii]|nr:AMP-binding protein [Bordetella hinzii]
MGRRQPRHASRQDARPRGGRGGGPAPPGQDRLSFAELNARAHALACALHAAGVGAGGCVGIYLPNGCAAVWADYGATISGACLVHLNAAYTR